MVKYNELFRALKRDGWYVVRQKGSHIFMKHISKKRIIIVPYHSGKEISAGLLKKIIKEAEINFRKR